MIDGGEGLGAPDGSDPRYPWRDGIEDPSKGDTEWVLGYMRRHGVTSSNLAFYLGTHAHSDHIDSADDIIYEFHPQVILTPEYSDEWITDKSRLWDNQWCYDNMMTAARWAASTYGATVMQHVNDDDTHIQLGDMDVQLIPVDPDENYKKVGVRDANLIAYTAKVSAFGSSAYLAADLEARGGYEDRIAPIVGHVDLLKAGHHGMSSSNFPAFMEALSPSMIVQTGPKWFTPDNLTDSVIRGMHHGRQPWIYGRRVPSPLSSLPSPPPRAFPITISRPRPGGTNMAGLFRGLVVQGSAPIGDDRMVARALRLLVLLRGQALRRGLGVGI